MIGVCLYLYHIDLWEEFKKLLLPLQDHIHLYLGLCKDHGNQNRIIDSAITNFNTTVNFNENYGADIAPFLNQLNLIEEPYFIKVHSKKSLLGQYQQINWRKILLYDLLDPYIFQINMSNIQNKNCGAIGNRYLLSTNNENYHSNKIQEVCNILDINYNKIHNYSFFGGSMFMSKTDLFKKHFIKHNNLLQNILKSEKNKVEENPNGTFSHALERIFGYIIPYNNLKFYYSNHKTIKIKNYKAPQGQFNLIITYDNECYIAEDLNVYGHILAYDPKNILKIRWSHLPDNPEQEYRFVDYETVVQNPFDNSSLSPIIHE